MFRHPRGAAALAASLAFGGSPDRFPRGRSAPNPISVFLLLPAYFSYYHRTRPHLALDKDSPESRNVQPPELGRVVAIPEVGLHHR
jgi:hypothetical protein